MDKYLFCVHQPFIPMWIRNSPCRPTLIYSTVLCCTTMNQHLYISYCIIFFIWSESSKKKLNVRFINMLSWSGMGSYKELLAWVLSFHIFFFFRFCEFCLNFFDVNILKFILDRHVEIIKFLPFMLLLFSVFLIHFTFRSNLRFTGKLSKNYIVPVCPYPYAHSFPFS